MIAKPEHDDVLVKLTGLCVVYGAGGGLFRTSTELVRAVDGVDLDLHRGETLGLVGESGCGKSSLARAMVGLRPAAAGTVEFDGLDIARLKPNELRALRRRMQIVFQDAYGSLNPRMTIEALVEEPMRTHGIGDKAERKQRVDMLLGVVGLDRKAKVRYPHEFSGGQRQRVGLARALSVDPELLVCDEPVSALDVSIQAQILNLLADLKDQFGLTYLFIAHDLAVVRHISDRVGVMFLGKVVELAATDALYAVPSHPYTKALLSAADPPTAVIRGVAGPVGGIGDVSPTTEARQIGAHHEQGCRFAERCWLYERLGRPERCRTEEPALRAVSAMHDAACHFADEVPDVAV